MGLFVRGVEEGTIAAVAEAERIAAPALGKRLAEHAARFGVPLLTRTSKGTRPTAAGTKPAMPLRNVLDDVRNLVLQMHACSDGLRGSARILANISAISTSMPSIVRTSRDRYPGGGVSLLEANSLAITEAIAQNATDIGVFRRLPHDADIEMHALGADELVVMVPGRRPLASRRRLSFAETLDHGHVVLCSGTRLRFQMPGAVSRAGKTLRGKVEVASPAMRCVRWCAPAPIPSPAGALIEGIRTPGARRVAIITPYVKPRTCKVIDYIEGEDIEVADSISLEAPRAARPARPCGSARQRRGRCRGAVRLRADAVAADHPAGGGPPRQAGVVGRRVDCSPDAQDARAAGASAE
ncbi:LysR family transcriptional regulator [Burkholderia plantarii]|uniref:LysR family transcriptional regulator n=1 Tax=Burkholderia plantarii TaxID=41899 RepID=UPI001F5B427A|nr:LysR family transcriptional regulator [Burkholderia plantarii]